MNRYSCMVFVIISSIIATHAFSEDKALDYSPMSYDRNSLTREMRISRGGQLYDNWWKTTIETEKPKNDHALWKSQNTNKRSGYSTFRCKECHGWDYRGKDGAYGKGSHYTGFSGVYDASGSMSDSQLESALKGSTNKEHDFSKHISESDISDLALFLKYGIVDIVQFVNSDGSPLDGDITAGRDFYTRNCMTECHGPQGMAINFGSEEKPQFIGTIAKKNPWEFVHKVRAGQPGTRMSSGIINKWSGKDIRSLLKYAQSLPTSKPELGFFDRMLEMVGMGEKALSSKVHEEHRGFGPKLD